MGNRFPIHYGRINEIVQDLITYSLPNEWVGFSRETAERIGYKILSYKEDEVILQKPKNIQ